MSDRPQPLIGEGPRPEQTLDPFVLFPAILSQMPDTGAIITATTQCNQPYQLARAVQSLNLLFPGRIGWNIVSSWHPEIAANFGGEELPDRATRYARAEEFVEVVLKLWNSWSYPWGEGELKSFGTSTPIDHEGAHFRVKGPLNLPAAPWGRPRIVQARGGGRGGRAGRAPCRFRLCAAVLGGRRPRLPRRIACRRPHRRSGEALPGGNRLWPPAPDLGRRIWQASFSVDGAIRAGRATD